MEEKVLKNIPLFKVFMPANVIEPLKKVLYSGYIGQGKEVEEFEKGLREFIGNPYGLALDSGTHALNLALHLANVKPGDEVISTPLTCIATNSPIKEIGAIIKWADICPDTGNMDPNSIERLITPKTKTIIYVHWAGNPGDIDKINEIASKYNIKVIEDAAHSFGAEYKGKKLGCHSDFVMFSFQAIKHMTTGDGGALFCKNKEDFDRGRALRWFGLDRNKIEEEKRWYYDIEEIGYKYNMNNIDATIGIEQLKYIKENLEKHRRNGKFYDERLSKISGIKTLRQEEGVNSVYWVYTFLADKRKSLIEYLNNHGINNSIVHIRNDIYTCFKEFKSKFPLEGLDKFSEKYISIPCGWWVSEEDARYIVNTIKKFYNYKL